MSTETLIYQSEDGALQLPVALENETVWLSQTQMVALFGRDKSVISRHIRNIFNDEELLPAQVVAKFATTANQ